MTNPLTTYEGTPVDVYWNLHRNIWSVRDRATRRVVGHTAGAVLTDVTFIVSQAGNARVRATGRKNVHAFARGTLLTVSPDGFPFDAPPDAAEITYNPYLFTSFVTKADRLPVRTATLASLGWRTVYGLGLDIDSQSGKMAS